jgi:Ca2+-binding RTX toxin-like protein
LVGGSGDDVLKGGWGDDQIWGESGNDFINEITDEIILMVDEGTTRFLGTAMKILYQH